MLNYNTIYHKSTIYDENINEEILNLLDKTFTILDDFNFNIFTVTKEYIARPDLISKLAYDDDSYTDIICKLNGISNPFELNEGMALLIPTPEYIGSFVHIPTEDELQIDKIKETDQPIAKNKTEKRKANEAVVGDDRFKIDPINRVIIY